MRATNVAVVASRFLTAFTSAERVQQPLQLIHPEVPERSSWNLNFSASAPHFFASVYGLLQQWPNTFFPNGHSIVPCEIPPLTTLYHGRKDAHEVPSPEWVSFDMLVLSQTGTVSH